MSSWQNVPLLIKKVLNLSTSTLRAAAALRAGYSTSSLAGFPVLYAFALPYVVTQCHTHSDVALHLAIAQTSEARP
jgi:hypothetical protein